MCYVWYWTGNVFHLIVCIKIHKSFCVASKVINHVESHTHTLTLFSSIFWNVERLKQIFHSNTFSHGLGARCQCSAFYDTISKGNWIEAWSHSPMQCVLSISSAYPLPHEHMTTYCPVNSFCTTVQFCSHPPLFTEQSTVIAAVGWMSMRAIVSSWVATTTSLFNSPKSFRFSTATFSRIISFSFGDGIFVVDTASGRCSNWFSSRSASASPPSTSLASSSPFSVS